MGLTLTGPRLWVIALIVLLSQLSISALNDWADRERDARAGRQRPIPIGLIDPRLAATLAGAFAIGSLAAALPFGVAATLVLIVGLAAGWSYDLWLKPSPFSFVPFALAFPLLPTWVGLVLGQPFSEFAWLIAAGAFLGVAIHVADSLPDLEADRQAGIRSLAVVLGARGALTITIGCVMVATVLAAVGLRSSLLLAGLLLLAGVAASALVTTVGPGHPAVTRWIVAAYGIAAALALLPPLPNV